MSHTALRPKRAKLAMWLALGIASALLVAQSQVFAAGQSTDRDNPTPLTSSVLPGTLDNGTNNEYFYSFPAGPGEVKVTLDVTAATGALDVEVDCYDEDGNELASLMRNPVAPAKDRQVQRFQLSRHQTIVMGVVRNSPGDSSGSYRIRLEGAVKLAAPAPPPPPPAAPAARSAAPTTATLTVPAGSVVTVRMVDSIDSSRARPGQEFAATVDSPVVAGGDVLIPKDSQARVRLVEAKSAGHFRGRSELRLELASITVGGKQYSVESGDYGVHGASRGNRTAEMVGGGAALGGLIGALAGRGKGAAIGAGVGAAAGTGVQLATHGQKVRIPSETKLDFTLTTPLTITPAVT